MSLSLREQLLKAGLVTEKQARKAGRETSQQQHQRKKSAQPSPQQASASDQQQGTPTGAGMQAAAAVSTILYFPFKGAFAIGGAIVGGLASTVFWPICGVLEPLVGWRGTLLAFAGLHLLVCLPVHLLMLPGRPVATGAAAAPATAAVLSAADSRRAFWLLTLAFSCGAFIFTGFIVHAIGVLRGLGHDPATALLLASLIGPAQVAVTLQRRIPTARENGEPLPTKRVRQTTTLTVALRVRYFGLEGRADAALALSAKEAAEKSPPTK